jgi:chaperonin GroEL
MVKLILFEDEARLALKKGVDTVADAVKTTLGPRGRNVAIDRRPHIPLVTHDGVTVAKDIELFDVFQNMGAQIVKTAALRTNDLAGDGTTTATVVAQSIVAEGLHAMAAGANPMLIKRGLDQGVEKVAEYLRAAARPVQGRDDVAHVATIASADPTIGDLLGELMDRVGKDGVVTVEESQTLGITTEYQEGIEIEHGWISPYFITDEARQEGVVENAVVLISGRKIQKIPEIVPILERVLECGEKNLFIVAEDIESDALSTLVLSKLKGSLNVVATKPPAYGDRRKLELEDIAALTGAEVISEDSGQRLEDVSVKQLGRARRVVCGKDRTTVLGGTGAETSVQSRIQALRSVLAETYADYDREWLQKRLARLTNGIGVIRVGASTKIEQEEKKARIEDALAATRAAVAEGILPGGGVAYLNAARALNDFNLPGDQGTGVAILRRALEEPLRLLAENAGESGSVVLAGVRRHQAESNNPNIGYNVLDGTYVDMLEAGVIDPVKVARVALENGVSVASLVLTAEALVSEPPEIAKPEPKNKRRRPY